MAFRRYQITTLSAAVLLALSLNNANASGFNVPEISTAGLGTSNAVVANPKMLGAVPYNPSLSAFHLGTTVTGAINVVHAESKVTPTLGTPASFQGQDNVFIPNIQITHQVNDQVTLGLGTSVPFGLSTQYPLGTFGTLAAFDPDGVAPVLSPGALQPTKSQVEIVDVAPTASFRIDDSSAVAIGLDYYRARKIVFDAQDIKNDGDGDGWGWNISASHLSGPWSFGASYRSRAVVDISGTTVFGLAGSAPASAKLTVPWRAQIGARYQVSPALAVEGDITRTGWGSFDVLTINNAISPVVSTHTWKDSNAYRFGATYQLDGATELRFGYSYDNNASPDAHYSARTADSNRHLFSIGAERSLGDGLAIEAGYMLVKFEDRNFAGVPFGAYGADANGTAAYGGKYETTVHILGIGLSKRF